MSLDGKDAPSSSQQQMQQGSNAHCWYIQSPAGGCVKVLRRDILASARPASPEASSTILRSDNNSVVPPRIQARRQLAKQSHIVVETSTLQPIQTSSTVPSGSAKPISFLNNAKEQTSINQSVKQRSSSQVAHSTPRFILPAGTVYPKRILTKKITPHTREPVNVSSVMVPVSVPPKQSVEKGSFMHFKLANRNIQKGDSRAITVSETNVPAGNHLPKKDVAPADSSGLVLQQIEATSVVPLQSSLDKHFVTLKTVKSDVDKNADFKIPTRCVIRKVCTKPHSVKSATLLSLKSRVRSSLLAQSAVKRKLPSQSAVNKNVPFQSAVRKNLPVQSPMPKQVFAVKTIHTKTSTQDGQVICLNDSSNFSLQSNPSNRIISFRPNSGSSSSTTPSQMLDKQLVKHEDTNHIVSVEMIAGKRVVCFKPIREKVTPIKNPVTTLQSKQGNDITLLAATNVQQSKRPYDSREAMSSESYLNKPVVENEVMVHTSLSEQSHIHGNEYNFVNGNTTTKNKSSMIPVGSNADSKYTVSLSQMSDTSVDSRVTGQILQATTDGQLSLKSVVTKKTSVDKTMSNSRDLTFVESSSLLKNSALQNVSSRTSTVKMKNVSEDSVASRKSNEMFSREQQIKLQLIADSKGFLLKPMSGKEDVLQENANRSKPLTPVLPIKNIGGETCILKTDDSNNESMSELKILENKDTRIKIDGNKDTLGSSIIRDSSVIETSTEIAANEVKATFSEVVPNSNDVKKAADKKVKSKTGKKVTFKTGNRVKPKTMNKQPNVKKRKAKRPLSSQDDAEPHPLMFNADELLNVLDWKDGIGALPGSKLKFRVNGLGMMELVEDEEFQELMSGKSSFVTEINGNSNSSVNRENKENNKGEKINTKGSRPSKSGSRKMKETVTAGAPDDIYFCKGCNCYGLSSEYYSREFCSFACATNYTVTEVVEIKKRGRIPKKKKEEEIEKTIEDASELDDNEEDIATFRKRRKRFLSLLKEYLERNTTIIAEVSTAVRAALKTIEVDYIRQESAPPNKAAVKTHTFVKPSVCPIKDDNLSGNTPQTSLPKKPWQTGKCGFSWFKYLDFCKAKAAPEKLFKDPFPYCMNAFKVGMKLEGLDPIHPSYVCVLTIKEVQGYRMRLHFDGYSDSYDFWVNADSTDIFPVGWCERNELPLLPPKDYGAKKFNWGSYIKKTKSQAAPRNLFANKDGNAVCPNGFRKGMKLEAVNRKHHFMICVATVTNLLDSRILIHFDGWGDTYDYWADISSPYIHPVGWCNEHGKKLHPPKDYEDPEIFCWEKYLQETASVAAPSRAFKARQPCGFRQGMKLECVDKRVPALIRVATVEYVKDHRLKISFDGWPSDYNIWMDDDSFDIHPVGWCDKTGHPLEPPLIVEEVKRLGCPVPVCRGVGHVKGISNRHSSSEDCPYAPENLKKKLIQDRLVSYWQTTEDYKQDAVDNIKSDIESPARRSLLRRRVQDQGKLGTSSAEAAQYVEETDLESSCKRKRGNVMPSCEDTEIITRVTRSGKYMDGGKASSKGPVTKTSYNKPDAMTSRTQTDATTSRGKPHTVTSSENYTDFFPPSLRFDGTEKTEDIYQQIEDSIYNQNPSNESLYLWAKHTIAYKKDIPIPLLPDDLKDWGPEEVHSYVLTTPGVGVQDIADKLRELEIDGEAFIMLTQNDLMTIIGCKFGPAIKVYNSIVHLRAKYSLL